MARYVNPITNRTEADIIAKTSKAFFNLADWLRIYSNSHIVKVVMDFLFGTDVDFTPLTAPGIATIPTAASINALITNIENLRLASGLPVIPGLDKLKNDWLAGSSAQAPDFEDVNAWERVLNIIFKSLAGSVEYVVYCGVSSVGQGRFYQHRWRQYAGWVPDSISPVRRPRANVATCGTEAMRQNGFRRYA